MTSNGRQQKREKRCEAWRRGEIEPLNPVMLGRDRQAEHDSLLGIEMRDRKARVKSRVTNGANHWATPGGSKSTCTRGRRIGGISIPSIGLRIAKERNPEFFAFILVSLLMILSLFLLPLEYHTLFHKLFYLLDGYQKWTKEEHKSLESLRACFWPKTKTLFAFLPIPSAIATIAEGHLGFF